MKRAHSLLALGLFLASCRLDPAMAEQVVLVRPRLAPTVQTVPVGSLQVEGGVALDPGERARAQSFARVGLSSATEGYAGGDVYREDLDRDVRGTGDLQLGLRHRFLGDGRAELGLALQAEVKLPTSDSNDGFGSGETDFHLTGIAEQLWGSTRAALFAAGGFLGKASGSGTDFEGSLGGFLHRPIADRFSGSLETVYFDHHGLNRSSGRMGAALYWHAGTHSAWDVGITTGFGDQPEGTQILVGYTRNVGAFYVNR
ncbi:MAG: hypothetical protein KDB61_01670 [Planctomycetes bacterium]|nr:hypothetical protein [Planctomycetota bacterium]